MEYQYDYAIVGGDLRQVYLAEILKSRGYRVTAWGLGSGCVSSEHGQKLQDSIEAAKNIVGPVPFTDNESSISHKYEMEKIHVSHFMSLLKRGQRLFAGCIPGSALRQAAQEGIPCYDLMEEDSIAVLNGIATAEGVIAEAIMKYPSNLQSSNTLVLGFGRCGKTLAGKLKYLVKRSAVTVRNQEQKAQAMALGLEAVESGSLRERIQHYDLIFNSVPQLILKESILKEMKPGAMIFDIATSPGGVDFNAAERLGIEAAIYPSLPGKYSPKSSAEILADFIIEKSN